MSYILQLLNVLATKSRTCCLQERLKLVFVNNLSFVMTVLDIRVKFCMKR